MSSRAEGTKARRHGGTKGAWCAALLVVVLVLVSLLAGACESTPRPILDPAAATLRWPPAPEPARIFYLGTIATSDDLGRPATLGETIFGREPTRSMLSPYAVVALGERAFVADSNGQVVHVFDLDRRRYERWTPAGDGETGFAQPVGLALDPRGRLLVADSVAGCVHAFGLDGRHLGVIGAGLMQRPCGIAVDAARGRLFVADAAAHEVLVLSLDGALRTRLGGRGTGPGEFNFPTNVAVDDTGRLYVADTLNFRVQAFDAALAFAAQVGQQGDVPGSFAHPKGLALDSDGHLYVVDAHFETVQIFDRDGTLLLAFGREGTGPGEFWLPAGIHVDASDRIWIADPYNRRVQVFQYRPHAAPEDEGTPEP